jgi:hypothetical protein
VVATYGGKGSDRIAGVAAAGLATTAHEVLQNAREISLTVTTADEEAALPNSELGIDTEDRAAIRRSGLAAFLVAGPALERKLHTGRHAPGDPPCPEGLAVVAVAIDWARCGRTDPTPDTLLRELWTSYLPPGAAANDTGYMTGLTWAEKPVAGAIALISRTAGFTAYDYVVRLRHQDPAALHPRSWSGPPPSPPRTPSKPMPSASLPLAQAASTTPSTPSPRPRRQPIPPSLLAPSSISA